MKIEEVINVVFKLENDVLSKNPSMDHCKLHVYMTNDYWHECMMEIRGQVSIPVHEFSDKNTILGHPVHRVISDGHPPFKVTL